MKPIDLAGFEQKFAGNADPWSTFTNRDEAHKRGAILHGLGSRPIGRVLELAAGNGSNSVALAHRALRLDATEGAESGVELVRRAVGADRHVRVRRLVLPGRFPAARYDAVVVAEVLYYLSPRALRQVARDVAAALRSGGRLVLAAIQAMPVFQTNGVFDPAKYAMIFENALQPRGFGKEQLEELVRDDLRLTKLKALLGATTVPSPTAVREAYDQHYQKTEAAVVRLKLGDFLATATAPDEDVTKLFEARKTQLKSDELRTVRFAAFTLPPTDKPLEGKPRTEALAKLGKAAEEFTIAMTAKDANFDELAAKAGVKAEVTPAFSRQQPAAAFAAAPAVVAAAFKLTLKEPNSDVKTSDHGYYVLQLTGITEARPLTFEEAKPQLVEQLRTERAQEALNLKATEIRNKIEAEMKAGKSFADAAQAAGVKAEAFGVFSQAEPKMEAPDAREIMMTAIEMKAGELSPFTPTATGGVLIHVGPRPPVDEAKFATDQVLITDGLTRANREMLFAEWLKLRRAEAQVTTNRRG